MNPWRWLMSKLVAKERNRVLGLIKELRSYYDERIFAMTNLTQHGRVARLARVLLDRLAAEVEAGLDPIELPKPLQIPQPVALDLRSLEQQAAACKHPTSVWNAELREYHCSSCGCEVLVDYMGRVTGPAKEG